MSGFNETNVPSTHYPSFDGPNPFPIRKEAEPMKLSIKHKDGQIYEYDLSLLAMPIEHLSNMDIVLAYIKAYQAKKVLNSNMNQLVNSFDLGYQAPKWETFIDVDDQVLDAINFIEKFMEHDWSASNGHAPGYAHSTRFLTPKINGETGEGSVEMTEMLVREMGSNDGDETKKHRMMFEFRTYTASTSGAHYQKRWPYGMMVTRTDDGLRIMWVKLRGKKGHKFVFGSSYETMANKKLVPGVSGHRRQNVQVIQELINVYFAKNTKIEDWLPIAKYMECEDQYENHVMGGLLYPFRISQSMIYWIGGETSVKKILNKAYQHHHGVTKNIFGGINNINTMKELRAAIALMQVVRGFNPQVLEKLDLREVTRVFSNNLPDFKNELKAFFKHFGCREEFLLAMFGRDMSTEMFLSDHSFEAADAVRIFKYIKGRNHRVAIKNHIARTKMSPGQIHDFINAEFQKIRTANKEIAKSNFWKKFGAFDGKLIREDIQVVVPKMTHDLVEWGATQNNCIGSYADRVYNNQTMIIGFKDDEGNWIGHAEIRNDMTLTQLLGKHNQPLAPDYGWPIINFIKHELEVTVGHYWGE